MMRRSKTSRHPFSAETIKRLSLYVRNLRQLQAKDTQVFSSSRISQFLNITPDQFRKDLSYFGEFGKRGVGYQVSTLIEAIERILGLDKAWKIALVGVGRLGSALLGFPGFSSFNMKIVAAFDSDKGKVGTVQDGLTVLPIARMKESIRENKITIAMVCTPPEVAQEVCDILIDAGVKAILNYAPVNIKAPREVFISTIDMACELESLIYFINR